MIYRITYDNKKRKLAHPIKNREELMALRDSKANLENLAKARQGDEKAKAELLQLAYNLGHVDGLIAGCKSQGSFFFHDVDCYDAEQSDAFKELILSKKEAIGLMMLEGTTILESQVRVATELQIEMDTNTKDLQRVVYSTSGSLEDLPYLDDALFEEPMTAEECEAEFLRLKERERKRQEQLPAGAKKANKHFKPWESPSAGSGTIGTDPSQKTHSCVPLVASDQRSSATSSGTVLSTGSGSVPGEADERTRFIFRECMKEEGVITR